MNVVPGDALSHHMAPVCDSRHLFLQPHGSRPAVVSADSPVCYQFSCIFCVITIAHYYYYLCQMKEVLFLSLSVGLFVCPSLRLLNKL